MFACWPQVASNGSSSPAGGGYLLMAPFVESEMRYAPNHRPAAYMMNMTPNRPPLANEMFHRFLVATRSASPR